MARRRVAVVGAGILGAALAWHLAEAGAAVTLVEGEQPGGGVTGKAFGWINVASPAAAAQAGLRRLALGEWHRLDRALRGALAPRWQGALTWQSDAAATAAFVAAQRATGLPVRLVERDELRRLEPALRAPPPVACLASEEGWVEPAAAVATLVAAAVERGTRLVTGLRVTGIATSDGQAAGLLTDGGRLAADRIVLAAGLGSVALAAALGVALPVAASPAIRIDLSGPAPLLRRIVSTPRLELRPDGAGGLVAAEDYLDDSVENGPPAVARRLLAAIREDLAGAEELSLTDVQVGQRPMPSDELPILGFAPGVPGLYLAALHAGVTLAPLVGRLAAEEIVADRPSALLDGCRPARFAR